MLIVSFELQACKNTFERKKMKNSNLDWLCELLAGIVTGLYYLIIIIAIILIQAILFHYFKIGMPEPISGPDNETVQYWKHVIATLFGVYLYFNAKEFYCDAYDWFQKKLLK